MSIQKRGVSRSWVLCFCLSTMFLSSVLVGMEDEYVEQAAAGAQVPPPPPQYPIPDKFKYLNLRTKELSELKKRVQEISDQLSSEAASIDDYERQIKYKQDLERKISSLQTQIDRLQKRSVVKKMSAAKRERLRDEAKKAQYRKAFTRLKQSDKSLNFVFFINNGPELDSRPGRRGGALRCTFEMALAQKCAGIVVSQGLLVQLFEQANEFVKKMGSVAVQVDRSLQIVRSEFAKVDRDVALLCRECDELRRTLFDLKIAHTGDVQDPDIQAYLALYDLQRSWLIYQNKALPGRSEAYPCAYDVYVMIPREYAKLWRKKDHNLTPKDLAYLGFNLNALEPVEGDLRNTKSVPELDDRVFSNGTVSVLRRVLVGHKENRNFKLAYLLGHGDAESHILGLTRDAALDLISYLGGCLNYFHIASCFAGGVAQAAN